MFGEKNTNFFHRIIFGHFINLVQNFGSLKQQLSPFCNLTKSYTFVLEVEQIVEAMEWI